MKCFILKSSEQYFDYLAPLGIRVFELDYTDVNS